VTYRTEVNSKNLTHLLSFWSNKTANSTPDKPKMQKLFNLFNSEWWRFEWRYWRRQTPWDTRITPPEVMEFLETAQPGRALDLGCGTGTNAITLGRYGWQVTGLDFSWKAIRAARNKAARARLSIDFEVMDVGDLGELDGLYDYALDIGCLFNLQAIDRKRYVSGLASLLRPGATYMLYAHFPKPSQGKARGIAPKEVTALFAPTFAQKQTVIGEEKGSPSAWYWMTKM
jgi:2-polyprenyl-3-methyl-5-hydroxy-6-metoxy-1,4-benzoquinol methylase